MDRINQLLRKVPTWLVYIVGLIPVPLFLYLARTGGLGREPIKALEHELIDPVHVSVLTCQSDSIHARRAGTIYVPAQYFSLDLF